MTQQNEKEQAQTGNKQSPIWLILLAIACIATGLLIPVGIYLFMLIIRRRKEALQETREQQPQQEQETQEQQPAKKSGSSRIQEMAKRRARQKKRRQVQELPAETPEEQEQNRVAEIMKLLTDWTPIQAVREESFDECINKAHAINEGFATLIVCKKGKPSFIMISGKFYVCVLQVLLYLNKTGNVTCAAVYEELKAEYRKLKEENKTNMDIKKFDELVFTVLMLIISNTPQAPTDDYSLQEPKSLEELDNVMRDKITEVTEQEPTHTATAAHLAKTIPYYVSSGHNVENNFVKNMGNRATSDVEEQHQFALQVATDERYTQDHRGINSMLMHAVTELRSSRAKT